MLAKIIVKAPNRTECLARLKRALEELAGHELNEDRAIDSLIQMCHALSNKLNAKISRQRLDQRFDEITKLFARASEASQDIDKQE